eukprot:tig00020553_g10782.t1
MTSSGYLCCGRYFVSFGAVKRHRRDTDCQGGVCGVCEGDWRECEHPVCPVSGCKRSAARHAFVSQASLEQHLREKGDDEHDEAYAAAQDAKPCGVCEGDWSECEHPVCPVSGCPRSAARFAFVSQASLKQHLRMKVDNAHEAYEGSALDDSEVDASTSGLGLAFMIIYMHELLENPSIMKFMHGCINDARTLRREYGVSINHVFDTQEAEKQIKGHKRPAGLNELLGRYAPHAINRFKQVVDFASNPRLFLQRTLPNHLLAYAASDVKGVLAIAAAQMQRIDSAEMLAILTASQKTADRA